MDNEDVNDEAAFGQRNKQLSSVSVTLPDTTPFEFLMVVDGLKLFLPRTFSLDYVVETLPKTATEYTVNRPTSGKSRTRRAENTANFEKDKNWLCLATSYRENMVKAIRNNSKDNALKDIECYLKHLQRSKGVANRMPKLLELNFKWHHILDGKITIFTGIDEEIIGTAVAAFTILSEFVIKNLENAKNMILFNGKQDYTSSKVILLLDRAFGFSRKAAGLLKTIESLCEKVARNEQEHREHSQYSYFDAEEYIRIFRIVSDVMISHAQLISVLKTRFKQGSEPNWKLNKLLAENSLGLLLRSKENYNVINCKTTGVDLYFQRLVPLLHILIYIYNGLHEQSLNTGKEAPSFYLAQEAIQLFEQHHNDDDQGHFDKFKKEVKHLCRGVIKELENSDVKKHTKKIAYAQHRFHKLVTQAQFAAKVQISMLQHQNGIVEADFTLFSFLKSGQTKNKEKTRISECEKNQPCKQKHSENYGWLYGVECRTSKSRPAEKEQESTEVRTQTKSKKAAYYVQYDSYRGGAPTRVYMSPTKRRPRSEYENLPSFSQKNDSVHCTLCEKDFTSIQATTTRGNILELRRSWGLLQPNEKRMNKAAFLYTLTSVCAFCYQFFERTPVDQANESDSQDVISKRLTESKTHLTSRSSDPNAESMKESIMDSLRRFHQNLSDEGTSEPQPHSVQKPEMENVALFQDASQSSTLNNDYAKYRASIAVDGNCGPASIIHTEYEDSPWWSVNLGNMCSISKIRVWNRRDQGKLGKSKLVPCWILLSRSPFDSQMTLEAAKDHAIEKQLYTEATSMIEWNLKGARARFVRIQLARKGVLHISQCQVFGNSLQQSMPKVVPEKELSNQSLEEPSRFSFVDKGNKELKTFKFDTRNWFYDRPYIPKASYLTKQYTTYASKVFGDSNTPTSTVSDRNTPKSNSNNSFTSRKKEFVKDIFDRCTKEYIVREELKQFQILLEEAVERKSRRLLSRSRKMTKIFMKRMSLTGIEMQKTSHSNCLRRCFDDMLLAAKLEEDLLQGDKPPRTTELVFVPANIFEYAFEPDKAAFPFVEQCVLIKQAEEQNQLKKAVQLLANIPHIRKIGVSWVNFMQFCLGWEQLIDFMREKLLFKEEDEDDSRSLARPKTAPNGTTGDVVKKNLASSSSVLELKRPRTAELSSSYNGLLNPPMSILLRKDTQKLLQTVNKKIYKTKLDKAKEKKMKRVHKNKRLSDVLSGKHIILPLREKVEMCAMCTQGFNDIGTTDFITRGAVDDMRESLLAKIGTMCTPKTLRSLERNLPMTQVFTAISRYDPVKVCTFCQQFFFTIHVPENAETIDKAKCHEMPLSFLGFKVKRHNNTQKSVVHETSNDLTVPTDLNVSMETFVANEVGLSTNVSYEQNEHILLIKPTKSPKIGKSSGVDKNTNTAPEQQKLNVPPSKSYRKKKEVRITDLKFGDHLDTTNVRDFCKLLNMDIDSTIEIILSNGITREWPNWRAIPRKIKLASIAAIKIQAILRGNRIRTVNKQPSTSQKFTVFRQESEKRDKDYVDLLKNMDKYLCDIQEERNKEMQAQYKSNKTYKLTS